MNKPLRRLIFTVLVLAVAAPVTAETPAQWADTLKRITKGVVSIRVDVARAFDTEWGLSSQATGFVVDAERGIILTNRHVVTPGPVVAEAVFANNEEVDLKPVYRDPVHDFGFFQYDPKSLKYHEPLEFALVPEGAQVGREIRVVGNDAGEKMSILAGTIARLDRPAPEYGRGKYNDFNTFYLQAASGTSGGSSGSPVVDINGHAVALNAGGSANAASSFFLPLDRVSRALKLIQTGSPVLRGTIQTVLLSRPYDELRRLGLRPETEAEVRAAFPDITGMLIVAQVVPGSPAYGLLEPGDIVVRVDGKLLTEFVPLEAILDDKVGETVSLEIQRGGQVKNHTIVVRDLHDITPSEYLEFGEAVVHTLSYQQARHFNRPAEGVYVANPGFVLGTAAIPRGSVITSVNGEPTNSLDDFVSILEGLADKERATVRYFSFDEPQGGSLRVIRMDRRWFPAKRCIRDDTLGYWPCKPLAEPTHEAAPQPGSTRFTVNGDARAAKIAPSLVMVNFEMPYIVSGVSERYYHGTGLVVDTERGLVVVDRNTVPVAMGDVRITIAGSLEIPGRVEYVHPLHNLSVVSYDPALVGDTPLRAARFDTRESKSGDELYVIGLKGDHKLASQAAKVASVDPVTFPLSRTFRFRDTNLESVSLVNPPTDFDGVLVNRKGAVVSLWSSFAYQGGRELTQSNKGVPADLVVELVDLVRSGRQLHSLEVEVDQIPLFAARKIGLPDTWLERLESHSPDRRQVLKVARVVGASPAAEFIRPGDLLLAMDGKIVNRFREMEKAAQKDAVEVTVWRDGEEKNYSVKTAVLDGRGINRAILWAGALLQTPHRAMAAQRGIEPEGVYVAYFAFGSPANRFGLFAGRRIVELDGIPTPDLDAFARAVANRPDRDSVRLKTVTWNNSIEVITLKLDMHYWPSYELRLADNDWRRTDWE